MEEHRGAVQARDHHGEVDADLHGLPLRAGEASEQHSERRGQRAVHEHDHHDRAEVRPPVHPEDQRTGQHGERDLHDPHRELSAELAENHRRPGDRGVREPPQQPLIPLDHEQDRAARRHHEQREHHHDAGYRLLESGGDLLPLPRRFHVERDRARQRVDRRDALRGRPAFVLAADDHVRQDGVGGARSPHLLVVARDTLAVVRELDLHRDAGEHRIREAGGYGEPTPRGRELLVRRGAHDLVVLLLASRRPRGSSPAAAA